MSVGLGLTGGKVGDGTSGLLDCGVAAGVCLGDGNSGARLLLAFAERLSLILSAFAFSLGVGDRAGLAFTFALELGLTAPPNGIPCSLCPVGGDVGCTA